MGLGGVTVQLSGVSDASAVTDDNGQYAFTGLRMGNYSVEISGFDSDEVGFSATAAAVTVGVGESKIISFDGTYLRTAGIMGRVSVEGAGLEGVMVSLAGGPDDADLTTETDAAGQYSFAKLRAGDYAVGISGYNTDDYEFELTSQNVTVALGETANVPFEGVLLRTAGVSGRVSVEGIGLEGVMVTLSMADAEDATAMTDAGGLYAFAGLAAGDYTVAIALSEEQTAAYVFETTSMDVTLEDDMTSIVNFEAEHAATASVTVRLFIDEGDNGRNDDMDEGEGAFPSAEMIEMVAAMGLPLPLDQVVSLAGPGVHDMQEGMTAPDGSVVFANLKAGDYQVIVTDIPAETLAALPPALAHVLRDYSYGGPATGYPVALTVGQEAMAHAPIDITHTTVHFGVTLKNGETRGMPLPGATVTLYADAMGETKVGEGMTMVNAESGHAVAAIRFPRAGTTGNMVHAGVAADSAYTVAAGMTPVPWDPQKTYTQGGNANDIVNLNVDVTYGGATIETEYGGGAALADWAVSVAHGDTMYADTLDAMGMAAFKMTVDSAGALPAMYTFSVDTIQVDSLHGGEMFEATTAEYMHTGLALAGTMDAGSLEVAYTTQKLKVYVHHERDQVMGYTGNILGGDARDGNGDNQIATVGIRHIDGSGRSRAFPTTAKITKGTANGVTTFSNVPADARVIVNAEVADGYMLLDPDELAAYTGTDANGITGGHFGAHGGYSHTVELCPLMAVDPTSQDHDECGSFAYVETHNVSGLVWKNVVELSDEDANDDRFSFGKEDGKDVFEPAGAPPTFVDGISVTLAPVAGKNLAGENQSATTAKDDKDTEDVDETHQFAFNDIAAGVYTLSVSDGWRARTPADTDELGDHSPKGATGMVGNALNPLAGNVTLDVTPMTTTVYGYVRDSDGFPVDEVTVTANGVEATTDVHGRYIAEYVPSANNKRGSMANTNTIAVGTAHEGSGKTDTVFVFSANSRLRADVAISGVGKTASVSGTVTASGSGDPIAGVVILVDDKAPTNAATSGANAGKLLTGADGTYTATFAAKDLGMTVRVSASKDGLSFSPGELCCYPAHAGSESSGANFTGFLHARISGRVRSPGGTAMSGVEVTATNVVEGGANDEATSTTNARGTFVLSVPFGTYDIEASAENHTFEYPDAYPAGRVSVAPGQSLSFGDIQALSPMARKVSATRMTVLDTIAAAAGVPALLRRQYVETEGVMVTWDSDGDEVPTGYEDATYTIETNTGAEGAWEVADGARVPTDGDTTGVGFFNASADDDGEYMVRIVATAANDPNEEPTQDTELVLNSDPGTVAAIKTTPSGATARRSAEGATTDSLVVTWTNTTNDRTSQRVVIQVDLGAAGTHWLVPSTNADADDRSWVMEAPAASEDWTIVGSTQTLGVTATDLAKALMVRVESQQGAEVDEDGDEVWRVSNTIAIAAKPAG